MHSFAGRIGSASYPLLFVLRRRSYVLRGGRGAVKGKFPYRHCVFRFGDLSYDRNILRTVILENTLNLVYNGSTPLKGSTYNDF